MQGKRYTEEQYRQKYNSSIFGFVLALGVEAVVLSLCTFQGFTYLDPPPPEKTFIEAPELVDQQAPVIKRKKGPKPAAEQVSPDKKIELVQKSEAPAKGSKPNVAKEATVGPKGDVEVPEPLRETPLDPLNEMPTFDNPEQKDIAAPQVAKEVEDALAAGRPDGNVTKGKTTGAPTAAVDGFVVDGVIAKPDYKTQKSGTVILDVWVDENGTVITGDPMYAPSLNSDSPSTDKELVNLAKEAAGRTHFKAKPNAEIKKYNQGTITYIFTIVGN